MSELDICTARDDDDAAAAAAATVVEYVGSTNSLDAFALRSQHQLHTYLRKETFRILFNTPLSPLSSSKTLT